MQAERRLLDLGPGRRIPCLLAGNGPDLVYFPGNGCDVADMQYVIPRLTRNHRFVGIDPPGRDHVEWPDEPFDFFTDMPALYDRVLAELGIGEHVVMGHSMGGMYALHHARRHPDTVRALVLFEGFTTLPIHYATAAPRGTEPRRMTRAVADAWRQRHEANKAWIDARPKFNDSFWPSQQPHDARPWVASLGKPILCIIGEDGQELPTDLDGWRQRLGMDEVVDLQVELIPNACHWMMLDDPERVGDVLEEFLARIA